jgi:hypothetical protein
MDMRMTCSVLIRQAQVLESGIDPSIFPRTNLVLRQVGYRAGRYRSPLDRYCAAVVVGLRRHILLFYRDAGPPLRDSLPRDRWAVDDAQLLRVLRAELDLIKLVGGRVDDLPLEVLDV